MSAVSEWIASCVSNPMMQKKNQTCHIRASISFHRKKQLNQGQAGQAAG